MWSRVMLKERGKAAFRRNYWKCVVVALILALFVESSGSRNTDNNQNSGYSYSYSVNDLMDNTFDFQTNDGFAADVPGVRQAADLFLGFLPETFKYLVIGSVFGVLVLLALALDILIFNVIEVGGCRFFIDNAFQPARIEEILCGFKANYGCIVVTQFLRGIFTTLWTLLFIIPGIVKSYEYCMIPYLLADYPDMTRQDAFRISKEMMNGNKWDTFVLDLSFLGWYLLSAVTFGIVGLFYVNPYVHATKAELYLLLRDRNFGNNSQFGDTGNIF